MLLRAVPRCALAASSAARFSTRADGALRVGILGAGRIAEVHLQGLQETSAVVMAVRSSSANSGP
jgi:hypothetical protein